MSYTENRIRRVPCATKQYIEDQVYLNRMVVKLIAVKGVMVCHVVKKYHVLFARNLFYLEQIKKLVVVVVLTKIEPAINTSRTRGLCETKLKPAVSLSKD